MPLRRRLPLIRTLLSFSAALIVVTAGALAIWRLDRVTVAPGMLAGGSIAVCAPRDGLIAEVLVRSGDRVRTDQPLLRLDTHDLILEAARRQGSIDAIEIRRRANDAEREHLLKAIQPGEREEAQRQAERARLRLAQAEIASQATSRLGQEGIAGQLQVQQAELEHKLAALAVGEADQTAALLVERQRSQLDALAAEIRRLDRELDAERIQREATLEAIENSLVRAVTEGSIVGEDLGEMAGRAVAAGDEVLRLAVAGPARFDGMLSDLARAQVRPNQRVKIRLDAYPWLLYGTLRGQVARVSDRREPGAGFPVEIELELTSAPGPLADGMRGTARIVIEEKVSFLRMFLESSVRRSGG